MIGYLNPNISVIINNYFKYKWSKHPNEKEEDCHTVIKCKAQLHEIYKKKSILKMKEKYFKSNTWKIHTMVQLTERKLQWLSDKVDDRAKNITRGVPAKMEA